MREKFTLRILSSPFGLILVLAIGCTTTLGISVVDFEVPVDVEVVSDIAYVAVRVEDGRAHTLGPSTGLWILDVSDPTDPSKIGTWP